MSGQGAGLLSGMLHEGAPLGRGRGVIVAVHGRGAAPSNILDVVRALEVPDFTCLAPAAADRAWYPKSFLAPFDENEPALSLSLHAVHTLVDHVLAAGIPASRVVLLGFSQGACLAGESVVRRLRPIGGLIMLSGGLIGPPGTTWPSTPTASDGPHTEAPLAGTRVFLGCSDRDSHIPLLRVRESAAVFERLGASVDTRIYEGMGHTVCDDELDAARALIAALH